MKILHLSIIAFLIIITVEINASVYATCALGGSNQKEICVTGPRLELSAQEGNDRCVAGPGMSCISTNTESPLKQFKSGIAVNDVVCKAGLELVVRSEDGYPACVKPEDAPKLIRLGWAEPANQSSQLELWYSSSGSAYPQGGVMGLIGSRPLESPQNFNMTSVVHNFPHDAITLHSYSFCVKLEQSDKIRFDFNSTAPTNFALYMTNNTRTNDNMVPCVTSGNMITELKNSTSYSDELNAQEDGVYTFVFDENVPVPANVNFVYSWIPR